MAGEPGLHLGCLVRPIVADDEMKVEVFVAEETHRETRRALLLLAPSLLHAQSAWHYPSP